MPIHEYQCSECGHQFEKMTLKQSEVKEEVECPNCNKTVAKRLVSAGGFIINGYNQTNGYDTVMR